MLTPYSQKVKHAFLRALPELGQFLSEAYDGVLEIQVPHPRIESGLYITTDGEEITLGFQDWHTHGDQLGGGAEMDQIRESVRFVADVLQDRQQLAVCYVNGEFSDAWPIQDVEQEKKEKKDDERLEFGTWSELARGLYLG